MKIRPLFLFILMMTFLSCGKKSSEPNESFELWSNHEAPTDFKIYNGQYWKSSHWSYEYITFLHFKAPTNWIKDFIKLNDLQIATGEYSMPYDAPEWFAPKVGQKVYIENGITQGSMYFVNEKTGEVFLYEIQL
jgi:hypothetical protein